MPNIYKYDEDKLIEELKQYIDSTYTQHYAKGEIQTAEFVIDAGHGDGYTIGNIIKYAQRYGKKNGYERKDILKILHYGIMLLFIHEREHSNIRSYSPHDRGISGMRA